MLFVYGLICGQSDLLTKADEINALNTTFEQAKCIAIEDALRKNTTIHERKINRLINDLSESKSVEMALKDEIETLNSQLKERPIQECAICYEEFNENRKRVAFRPCGHCPVCEQCSKAMKRKTERHQKNICPDCKSEIKFTVTLEGIY